MSKAYYNEIDAEAAAALRNLIAAGLIAPGDVDERDVRDVKPSDLAGYTQCHFFAGIGIWSLALRNAGVPDTANVWTGSCPCQPFSASGRRGGFLDERHLWPAWHWLIAQCRPEIVFGEQVASKDGLAWFDLVSADMEGTDYAIVGQDRCGPGDGAPHIRQRLWFGAVGLGFTDRDGSLPWWCGTSPLGPRNTVVATGDESRMADADDELHNGGWNIGSGQRPQHPDGSDARRPDTCDSPWQNADWIWCRDDKFRPVEPGTFPLAHGLPAGMGKIDTGSLGLARMAGLDAASLRRAKRYRVIALRCYGNAIIEPVAREWIKDFLDATADR